MPFEVSQLFCSEVSELADTFSLKFQSLRLFSEISELAVFELLFSEVSELADTFSLKFQSLLMPFL